MRRMCSHPGGYMKILLANLCIGFVPGVCSLHEVIAVKRCSLAASDACLDCDPECLLLKRPSARKMLRV